MDRHRDDTTTLVYTNKGYRTAQTGTAGIAGKIDRNQQYSSGVPSKVIIECGEQRDVPFLLLMCGRLANVLVDGYAISIYRPEQILRDSVYYPTYTITGDEDFMVYSNDAVQDDWRNSGITVVDLSEPEKHREVIAPYPNSMRNLQKVFIMHMWMFDVMEMILCWMEERLTRNICLIVPISFWNWFSFYLYISE